MSKVKRLRYWLANLISGGLLTLAEKKIEELDTKVCKLDSEAAKAAAVESSKETLLAYIESGNKGRFRVFVDDAAGERMLMTNARGKAMRSEAEKILGRLTNANIKRRE